MHIVRSWLLIGSLIFVGVLMVTLVVGRPPAATGAATGQAPDPATEAAFAKAGCAACHTIAGIPAAEGEVGPDLSRIGLDAESRIEGLDAEEYIRQSILDPGAFLAPACPAGPCPANVMPPTFGERLSPDEIDLISGYLLTLRGEGVTTDVVPFTAIPIDRPAESAVSPFAEPPKQYEDAQVLFGQYLFFDPRLSGDGSISCASCHRPEQGWADGQPLSDGYPGTAYFRNAPTVMNTVYLNYLYWDGRMDGADLPTLVRDHLTEGHFMNSDGRLMVERVKQVPEYVQLSQEAFGANPSFGRVLNALTAYVHSLNSGPTPYDLFLAGNESALSGEAAAGLALFEGAAGCAACHSGTLLTDEQFYNLGVPSAEEAIWGEPVRHITFRRFFRQLGTPNYRALLDDPGTFAITQDEAERGAFRTAPLREISRTAPYMHNGTFATLEEVVRFYDGRDALGLTDGEVAQLVAFLESLSSDPIDVTPPAAPPYQLRTLGENQ